MGTTRTIALLTSIKYRGQLIKFNDKIVIAKNVLQQEEYYLQKI